MTQVPNSSSILKPFLLFLFSDSNKTIADVLEEFEDGGCLADYDPNEVWGLQCCLDFFRFYFASEVRHHIRTFGNSNIKLHNEDQKCFQFGPILTAKQNLIL